jgi:hypothetical protein
LYFGTVPYRTEVLFYFLQENEVETTKQKGKGGKNLTGPSRTEVATSLYVVVDYFVQEKAAESTKQKSLPLPRA